MQGAEDEDEGSVLTYVTEAQIPKATQQIAFVQQSLLIDTLLKVYGKNFLMRNPW